MKARCLAFGVLALLLVLLLSSCGGGGGGGTSKGAVGGFVYVEDQVTGLARQPQVILSDSPEPPSGYSPMYPAQVNLVGQATSCPTGPNGSYFIGDLDPGTYTLRASDTAVLGTKLEATFDVEVHKGEVTLGDDAGTLDLSPKYTLADYFPLAVDNAWNYTIQEYEPSTSGVRYVRNTRTMKLTRLEPFGDMPAYVSEWFEDSTTHYGLKLPYALDSGRITIPGIWACSNSHYYLFEEPMVFPKTMQVGDSALFETTAVPAARDSKDLPSMEFRLQWSFIGLETVVTPAGTFNDCMHLKLLVSFDDITEPADVWFAEGVGPVAWTLEEESRPAKDTTRCAVGIERLLLDSYNLETPPSSVSLTDYWQPKIGDAYSWRVTTRSASQTKVSEEFGERFTGVWHVASGVNAYIDTWFESGEDPAVDHSLLMTNDDDGFRIYGYIESNGLLYKQAGGASNALTIPRNVEPGDHGEGTLNLIDFFGNTSQVDYEWRIMGFADVSVPAGDYPKCLMLDIRLMPEEDDEGLRYIYYLSPDAQGPVMIDQFIMTDRKTTPADWQYIATLELESKQTGYATNDQVSVDTQKNNYMSCSDGNWSLKEEVNENDYTARKVADTSVAGASYRLQMEGPETPYWSIWYRPNPSNGNDLQFVAHRDEGESDIFDMSAHPITIHSGDQLGDGTVYTYDDGEGGTIVVNVVLAGLVDEPFLSPTIPAGARAVARPSSLVLLVDVEDDDDDHSVELWYFNEHMGGMDRRLEFEEDEDPDLEVFLHPSVEPAPDLDD